MLAFRRTDKSATLSWPELRIARRVKSLCVGMSGASLTALLGREICIGTIERSFNAQDEKSRSSKSIYLIIMTQKYVSLDWRRAPSASESSGHVCRNMGYIAWTEIETPMPDTTKFCSSEVV